MAFGRPKKLKARWDKFYSKQEMNFKVPDISLYDQVKETAKTYPNYKAYTYFGTKDTFRGFHKEIIRCAKAFNALGVRKGDIVTICMPNTPVAIVTFYAINMIGATASMIHPLSSENEIKTIELLTYNLTNIDVAVLSLYSISASAKAVAQSSHQ